MESIDNIYAFLNESGWYEKPVPQSAIAFLAAGEYNENWRIQSQGRPNTFDVLRINHGSQLNLDNQISYEYSVLQAVAPSGVSPLPLQLAAKPSHLSGGALLMSYIEGRHLSYETDLIGAAQAFAAVHSVPVSEESKAALLHQPDPIAAIAAESLGMLTRDAEHPLEDVRTRLLQYHEKVVALGQDLALLFAEEANVLANTEVNSNNFLVQEETGHTPKRVYIVDWEKAVITPRYQDLGHFLAPTTTLWKTDTVLDTEERQPFLRAYHEALLQGSPSHTVPSLERLTLLSDALVRTVLLRGLSWCFMAWKEYLSADRALVHEHTRCTMERYLNNVEWFLR